MKIDLRFAWSQRKSLQKARENQCSCPSRFHGASKGMERSRREKKSRVDVNALNALGNAKRGVISRQDQHQVVHSTLLGLP